MGFQEFIVDAFVGTVEEITAFARRLAGEIYGVAGRLGQSYEKVHSDRQEVARSLVQIRYEVCDLRDAICEATENSHVGTQACFRALESATANLTDAIEALESISILD